MGKNLSSLTILFLVSIHFLIAQEPLCVFKANNVYSLSKTLHKGTLVRSPDVVTLQKNSFLSLIDKKGELYKIEKEGKYTYNQLITHKVENEKSSLTSKYLEYLWEEMTHGAGSETIIGGVFRGENLMKSPIDSSFVVSSKISFQWDVDSISTSYYIFIKNTQTEEVLKLETNGSKLSIYKDNTIFSEGTNFEWYVDTEAFPNLNNKTFNHFTLIDRTAYQERKQKYLDFMADLKQSGMTEEEIEQVLCETYGLCKF